jgi:AcrR family transcriptional regulator
MAQVSNREHLIEGAILCLQSKGYAQTTARDIAAASGANLASIGYHFGSKEGLLTEALVRILAERNKRIGQVMSTDDDASPLEGLTRSVEAVRRIFGRHRPLLVAFVEAITQAERSSSLREQMASNYREARRGAAAMLSRSLGPQATRLRTDPELMASVLIAIFDGLLIQYLLDPSDTPKGDELVEALADWMALAIERDSSR